MKRPPGDEAKVWHGCRGVLRRSRPLVLILLLAVAVWLYLTQIGLPNFLASRIQDQLRRRGIEVQFDRLRLRGFRTVVADNLRWGKTAGPEQPNFAVRRAELRFNAKALRRFRVQTEALIVRRGRLIIPFPGTNAPPAQVPLEDIYFELRFSPESRWDLVQFTARCQNADLWASGTITNAAAIRDWTPGAATEKPVASWQERLRPLITHLQRITFAPSSTLRLNFHGNGQDARTFQASLEFHSPNLRTPWGTLADVKLDADVSLADAAFQTIRANGRLRIGGGQIPDGAFKLSALTGRFNFALANLALHEGRWQFQAQEAQAPWGSANALALTGTLTPPPDRSGRSKLDWTLAAHALDTSLAKAESALLRGEFARASDPSDAWDGSWQLDLQRVEAQSALSEAMQFTGHVRRTPMDAGRRRSDASWGWWQMLEPIHLDWEGRARQITFSTLQLDEIESAGEWQAPALAIRQLHARLYEGQLELGANLHVPSRTLESRIALDFDARRLASLWATNSQRWFGQLAWEKPPRVTAEARLILPDWTNREPNRFKAALGTLALSGSLDAGKSSFRGVTASSAQARFAFTNSVLRLADCVVSRPEGNIRLDGQENLARHEFVWAIRSQIDLNALKPLLDPAPGKVLDYFAFTRPPFIDGHVWGRWDKLDQAGWSARLAMTNFTFRNEACDELRATLHYTNQLLSVQDADIRRGNQRVTASRAVYDLRAGLVRVTNGVTTMDPDVITRVIGPQVRAAISPYHFQSPPTVLVQGQLPTRSETDADATFRIAGQDFNYWRFHVPEISGDVYWRGETVSISNLHADFYRGKLDWEGKFDFSGPEGARFNFRGHAAQTDLRSLVADLTRTNTSLEGILDGNLVITSADTRDWQSWKGFGDAQLHNGFLWTVPIFGIFSPVLNKLVPGLGQSRISAASATFNIDHALIRTGDLEMRSPALHLQYVGTVDFSGRVNARAQAGILRDAWGVGRAVNLALWPLTKVFEYKVTGTLAEPKKELLYVPKFLMWPFHPFRTLKEILSVGEPATPSPAPPKADSSGKNPPP